MNIQLITRSNAASVQRVFLACIVCGHDADYADLDGPAFRAYYCMADVPAAPAPCYKFVDPADTADDGALVCHRLAGHDGACSDWSPGECLIQGCACTEEQAPKP